jgi:hypothetical protein
MDNFINNNIGLLNKNNILRIIPGKALCDNIFTSNLSEQIIKQIIANTKSISNKIKTYNYFQKIYSKGNEEFTVVNSEIKYIIKNQKDSFQNDKFLIINESYLEDNYILPNYTDYDKIENLEILDIMLISCFLVRVKKNKDNNQQSIEIIINKPNKLDKIKRLLEQIFIN